MSRPKLRRGACLPDHPDDRSNIVVFVVVLACIVVLIRSGFDLTRALAVVAAAIALAAHAARRMRTARTRPDNI